MVSVLTNKVSTLTKWCQACSRSTTGLALDALQAVAGDLDGHECDGAAEEHRQREAEDHLDGVRRRAERARRQVAVHRLGLEDDHPAAFCGVAIVELVFASFPSLYPGAMTIYAHFFRHETGLDFLADLYAFGAATSYSFVFLALIALRLNDPLSPRKFKIPFNLPLTIRGERAEFPLIAVIGFLGILSILVFTLFSAFCS